MKISIHIILDILSLMTSLKKIEVFGERVENLHEKCLLDTNMLSLVVRTKNRILRHA